MSELKQYDFHRFGAFYAYNASTSTFEFYKGEELKKANEERRPVEYPKTVHLIEETHPEIFSANGSHGHWASAGEKLLRKKIVVIYFCPQTKSFKHHYVFYRKTQLSHVGNTLGRLL